MSDFVKFPTGEKSQEVMEVFESKIGTWGVLPAIDGIHVTIKGPRNHSEQYISTVHGYISTEQYMGTREKS